MAASPQVLLCPRCDERTPHARFQRSAAPAFGWLLAAILAPWGLLEVLFLVCGPVHAAVVIVSNARAKVGCLRCAAKDARVRRANSYLRAVRQGRATFDM